MDSSPTPAGKMRPRPLRINSEATATPIAHTANTRQVRALNTGLPATSMSSPLETGSTPVQIPHAHNRHLTRGGILPSPPSTPPPTIDDNTLSRKLEDDAQAPTPQLDLDLSHGKVIGEGLWSKVYKLSSTAMAPPQELHGLLTPPSTPEKTKAPHLPQVFAVKSATRKDATEVFEEEARILSLLQEQDDAGRHVIPFYGLANNNTALVFEAAMAGNLEELIKNISSQPITDALNRFSSLAYQLTSALAFLHAANVVHADVKPSNVLISPSEADPSTYNYRLCDFTASFIADPESQAQATLLVPSSPNTPMSTSTTPSRSSSQRQPAGGGTWTYLAPEQLLSNPIASAPTFASDVYSLGILFMTFLLGANPYTGVQKNANIFLVREAIKMGEPKRFANDYGADAGGMDVRLTELESNEDGTRALSLIGLGVKKRKEDRIAAEAWKERCVELGWED